MMVIIVIEMIINMAVAIVTSSVLLLVEFIFVINVISDVIGCIMRADWFVVSIKYCSFVSKIYSKRRSTVFVE